MEARYEHKTEEFGASFDTGYRVITQCVADCPSCAFEVGRQEGKKEVVEWVEQQSQVEHCDPDVMRYFREYRWVDEEEWQARLKEWGINAK